MWWRFVIFTGILFSIVLTIFPHLIWFISFVGGKIWHYKVSYAPFGWTNLALVAILWILLTYGHFIGMWQVTVNEVEYASNNVPSAFDGYKIVHISDLHVDTYDQNPEALKAIVNKVNEQDADIILFTGDMSTHSLHGIEKHAQTLSQLKAKDGVKSVLGNHDFFIYDRSYKSVKERCAAADTLTSMEESFGWEVLRNRNVIIARNGEHIAIAGVDNINGNQGFKTIQKGDLSKAIKGIDNKFTILMTHDPSHWTAEVLPKSNVDITLSGHTHAAQVRLFGISLAKMAFNECDGRYDRDGRMLYVNAGIGCTAPFRIGCPSEITVITLKAGSVGVHP